MHCVECGDTLKAPRQIPLCESCHQEMLDYEIERLSSDDEGQIKVR